MGAHQAKCPPKVPQVCCTVSSSRSLLLVQVIRLDLDATPFEVDEDLSQGTAVGLVMAQGW